MRFHENMSIQNMNVTAQLHLSNKNIRLQSVDFKKKRFQNLEL